VASEDAPPEARRACASFYRVLDRMPAAEQLVFTLRHVEGMEVASVAQTCNVSLSTSKRRLAKAEERFTRLAAHEPDLSPWIKAGGRFAP
jgi:RNA polymerase sigma-70 factor (ECF subfamily)